MLQRATIPLLCITSAGAAALWVALPHRIEVHVRDAVDEHGVPKADIEADYSVSALWTGRLDSVVLDGVHYDVDLGDRARDLGAWSPGALCAALAALPADRVELHDASLTLTRGGQRWVLRVDAEVTAREDHAVLRASAAPAGGGAVTAVARCDRGPNGLLASATVQGHVPALRLGDLAGDDLAVSLDAAWTGDELAALTGTVEAQRVSGHELTFLDVAGRLRLDGGFLAVEASSVSDLGRVSGEARVPASAPSLAAVFWRVDVDAPYVELDANAPLHAWIADAVGIRVTGALGYRAHIERGPGVARERVDVSVMDADVELPGRGLRIDGLRGDLSLDRLSPPRTAATQSLTWTAARFGKHRLGAGVARFDVADDSAIALSVDVTHVDLATWVPALSRGAMDGSGLVDGRVDVRIEREPELTVHLATGALRARGPGSLRAHDRDLAERLVGNYLTARDAGDIGTQAQLRIAGALTDFRFTELRADLFDDPSLPEVRVTTRGAGAEVPQELDLTVNVTGAEDLLNPLLRELI